MRAIATTASDANAITSTMNIAMNDCYTARYIPLFVLRVSSMFLEEHG